MSERPWRHRREVWDHFGVVIQPTVDVMSGKRVIEVFVRNYNAPLTAAQADLASYALGRAARYIEQETRADHTRSRKRARSSSEGKDQP